MDPLTPLDRELTAALQVNPSPAFVARVRARVATDPIDSRWHAPGLVLAGGALAVVLCAAIMMRAGSPAEPSATALLPQRSAAIWAPLRDGLAPARAVYDRSRAPVSRAAVIVSPSEMAALQRLFSGRLVAPEWPDTPASALVIPQISIEPIVLSLDPEGAGQ